MCVAIIKPDGIQGPSDRLIRHLWDINKDGAGFCVIRDGLVTGYKGLMDKYEFIDKYRTIVKKNDRALIHFRITTRGGTHPGGTHPFPAEVEDDMLNATYWKSKFGIVHNGTIFGMGSKIHGKMSDTQEFIQRYLHDRILLYSLFSNRGSAANELLNDDIGASRIAIMRFDGRVIALGEWSKAGGCLYSKQDYKGIEPKTQKKAYRKDLLEDKNEKYIKMLNEEYNKKHYNGIAVEKKIKHEVEEEPNSYVKNGAKVYFAHDTMLKRMVPFYTKSNRRADDLIECPTCGIKEGTPCIYNDMECCSLCAAQMVEKGEILPDFLQTEYEGSGDVFVASELAGGVKKGKKIRKVLKDEHDLEYCPALSLFLPNKVCLECGYITGKNGSPECWLKEAARDEGQEVYSKLFNNMGAKLCYLEAETLEDVGGGRLSYDNFSLIERNYGTDHDVQQALGFDMMDNKRSN